MAHTLAIQVKVSGGSSPKAVLKVASDNNYLNAQVRVTAATLFGIALLIAGIWRRRKEPNIAQALSAAGIADLFACILAATSYYHWIPPTTGIKPREEHPPADHP